MWRWFSAATPARRRAVVAASVVAVGVVAVAGAVSLRGDGLRDGPLSGFQGVIVTLPVPGDGDVYYGNNVLWNDSDTPVVLESVELVGVEGDLREAEPPFLWGPDRVEIAGSGMLAVYQDPIPPEWDEVPRLALRGHELPPSPTSADGVELVFVFEAPDGVASAAGVRVTYVHEGRTYVEELGTAFVLCPGPDQEPCEVS